MARLTIQMQRRPHGGLTVFRIDLKSEEDTTPSEHEQDHRRLVAALLPGVDLDTENKQVQVERERPAREPMSCSSCGDDDYEVIDLG